MFRKSLLAVMAISVLVLSACNTVRGVGEDIESAGDAVSDTAE
ncbi:MAG: entericidin A/B family lipoprotein [Parasphingorhabdus sp.]|tara:strand:+ start:2372 stop:2500 length:129 start_codon:yes stop_codon:yes gene_type:complete